MKKLCFLLCVLCALCGSPSYGAEQPKPPRPNILVILADDMGYSDLGCYGSEISTPNLDRLAARGVRLTDFHNQARCCPSRAALLTGRYPHQVGIGTMIDKYAKWERDAAHSPAYQDHLSTDSPTMAELLRGAGYHTLMCGKWHLGDRPDEWPASRGFDRSFALIPGAMNYWGGESTGPRSPMALDHQKFVPPHDGFYSTDAFTDKAIEFVNESAKDKEKPFFLYLAYNAPHWPLQAPAEDIAKYAHTYDAGWQPIREARLKRMIDLGLLPKDAAMAPMDRGNVQPWDQLTEAQQKEWSLRMSIYAAQITREDQNVGRLLAQLDRLGQTDNTLVLFISDNGGAAEDPHHPLKPGVTLGSRDSFWGYARPWATVSNTPLRFHKCSAYEGGTSSPLIASFPSRLPKDKQGAIVKEPAHLIDLLPTFLEVAGAKDRPTNLEGQPILPMLLGQSGNPDRTYFWEHEGNRAVRQDHYKLVSLPEQPWELYDLAADRIESHNLAAEQPDKVKQLTATYDAWAKRAGVIPWDQLAPHRPDRGGEK